MTPEHDGLVSRLRKRAEVASQVSRLYMTAQELREFERDMLEAADALSLKGEDVERVARAIWEVEGHDAGTLYQHEEFEDWPVDQRQEYTLPGEEKRVVLMHYGWRKREKQARAAIAAMMEAEARQKRLEEEDRD